MSNDIKLNNALFQNIKVGNSNLSGSSVPGTTEHNALKNRDLPNQHPISAITGLQEKLDNLNQGSVNMDLSDYVKKEDGYGLSAIRYVSELQYYDTVTNTGGFGGIGYETQNGEYHEIHFYNQEQMDDMLAELPQGGSSGVYVGSGDMPENCNVQIDPTGTADDYYTKEEVKAYIEETLLGGAW